MLKNHNRENPTPKISDIISQRQINSILYSDPFLKAGFISRLVDETKIETLFIDLDLMYSGYLTSGTLSLQSNLVLYRPSRDTIDNMLKEILVKASTSQVLIIVDSVNGLFNVLDYKKQAGKSIASIIMLLASIGRKTNSSVVVASMVRYKKEEGWVLSPTGRRLIETKNSKKILLEHGKEGIIINPLDGSGKILLSMRYITL